MYTLVLRGKVLSVCRLVGGEGGEGGEGGGGGEGVCMYVGVTGRKIEMEGEYRLTGNYELCIG